MSLMFESWSSRDMATLAMWLAVFSLFVQLGVYFVQRPRLTVWLDTEKRPDKSTLVGVKFENKGGRPGDVVGWELREDRKRKNPKVSFSYTVSFDS